MITATQGLALVDAYHVLRELSALGRKHAGSHSEAYLAGVAECAASAVFDVVNVASTYSDSPHGKRALDAIMVRSD